MRATARAALVLLCVAVLGSACGREASKPERADGLPKLPVGGGGVRDEDALGAEAMATPARELKLDLGTVHPFEKVPAYRLSATAREADVAVLAKAFELEGEVERAGKGWRVIDGERELRVDPIAGAPWYLDAPQPGCEPEADEPSPDGAVSSSGCVSPSGGGSASGGGFSAGSAGGSEPSMSCDMPPCPPGQACAQVCPEKSELAPEPGLQEPARPVGLLAKEDAEERGREVLRAAGAMADGSGDVVVSEGFDAWNVSVRAEANGIEVVGLDSTVAIGVEGKIIRGSGWLAPGERIGDYPLVTPEKAFERLKSQQPEVEALERSTAVPCSEPGDAPVTDTCEATNVAPLPPLVLTSVRPVLIFRPTPETAYLVPGFAFGADDASADEGRIELTVVAVVDRFLEKETSPGDEPAPLDGDRPAPGAPEPMTEPQPGVKPEP